MRALPDFLAQVQAQRFDLALQLHGSGPIVNPLVATLRRAPHAPASVNERRVAARRRTRRCYAPWPEHGHEIQRLLALTDRLGLPRAAPTSSFRCAPTTARRWRALWPGAGEGRALRLRARRRAAAVAALAGRALRRGGATSSPRKASTVVLTGGVPRGRAGRRRCRRRCSSRRQPGRPHQPVDAGRADRRRRARGLQRHRRVAHRRRARHAERGDQLRRRRRALGAARRATRHRVLWQPMRVPAVQPRGLSDRPRLRDRDRRRRGAAGGGCAAACGRHRLGGNRVGAGRRRVRRTVHRRRIGADGIGPDLGEVPAVAGRRPRCPRIGAARRLLGWEPRVGHDDDLRRTSDYFRGVLGLSMPRIVLATVRVDASAPTAALPQRSALSSSQRTRCALAAHERVASIRAHAFAPARVVALSPSAAVQASTNETGSSATRTQLPKPLTRSGSGVATTGLSAARYSSSGCGQSERGRAFSACGSRQTSQAAMNHGRRPPRLRTEPVQVRSLRQPVGERRIDAPDHHDPPVRAVRRECVDEAEVERTIDLPDAAEARRGDRPAGRAAPSRPLRRRTRAGPDRGVRHRPHRAASGRCCAMRRGARTAAMTMSDEVGASQQHRLAMAP